MSTSNASLPHAVGIGRLAVPDTAADTGRTGSVGLLDPAGVPLRTLRVPRGHLIHLTASLPPGAARIDAEVPRWHLLGAGRARAVISLFGGRPGTAVGIEPIAERGLLWLHLPTRTDLTDAPIWLEAHPAWPCPCSADRRRSWLANGEQS